jgi:hypothetical protein
VDGFHILLEVASAVKEAFENGWMDLPELSLSESYRSQVRGENVRVE